MTIHNQGTPDRGEPLSTAEMAQAGERPTQLEDTRPEDHEFSPQRVETGPEIEPRTRASTSERGEGSPFFAANDAEEFRSRWNEIQTGFVDEPRRAVEQADQLVAQIMKRLAEVFADERSNLEQQWDRGDNISTEDLRVALQRYRSFFDRLLSV